jgi:hypothetical protein
MCQTIFTASVILILLSAASVLVILLSIRLRTGELKSMFKIGRERRGRGEMGWLVGAAQCGWVGAWLAQ